MKPIIRYPMEACELKIRSLLSFMGKQETISLLCFLAQGSNTLVYKGRYKGKPCVIKELFPEGLAEKEVLIRTRNGKIIVNFAIKNFMLWNKEKRRFKRALRINYLLRKSPELYTKIARFCKLYKTNGTFYLISDETEGRSWDTITEESIKRIIGIGFLIAQMTDAIHRTGWLVVDIKASNYIIIDQKTELPRVKLVDFDSMIPHKRMNRPQQYRCSSETAPPELLQGLHQNIGLHSDVYSIVAMLFYKLTQNQVSEKWPQVYAQWEKENLSSWKTVYKSQLKKIMEKALERDVKKRMRSCSELSEALKFILNKRGRTYEDL